MKNKISWLEDNQKQIQWAKNYLEYPHIKAKIKAISDFVGSHDYSTYIGIENLLTFLKSCDGGSDFIDTMSNAWSKEKSNKKDVRVKVESKITQLSRKNLTFIAKDLDCHLNEVFEHLLNKVSEENSAYDKKIDALKKRHKKDIDALKANYSLSKKVPKAIYDDMKSELLSTQKSIQEIEQIVHKLKNTPSPSITLISPTEKSE